MTAAPDPLEHRARDLRERASGFPLVISFAAGAPAYHEEARRLSRSLDELGLEHDIEHLEMSADYDWSQICRLKVQFYARKLREHRRPVLWVDADTQFVSLPTALRDFHGDFAAIPNRAPLARFDAYSAHRMWRPSFLVFGYTPKTLAFLDHMAEVDAKAPANVTDDYLLQESWATFNQEMSVMVLPLSSVARNNSDVAPDTWTIHGDSGNVGEYVDRVVQHDTILNRGRILTEIAGDYLKARKFLAAEALLTAAHDYGWDDFKWSRTSTSLLNLTGRREEANREVRRYARQYPEDSAGQLAVARMAMRERRYKPARRRLIQVIEKKDEYAGEARSILADLERETRADALGAGHADRVRLWWMRQPFPGNLGDALNPYVIEKLTGIPPVFGARDSSMLAIGSVVKFAGDGQYVWGTGASRKSDQFNPNAIYRAVRGPLTRRALLDAGANVPEVYGDPALLMPNFYQPIDTTKRYEVGLIRHVNHRGIGIVGDGALDLDLRAVSYEDIESFIDQLVQCKVVLSSSLHGIILAQAYGIPARWVTYSNTARRISGDDMKFADYMISVDQPVQQPVDMAQFPVVDGSLQRLADVPLTGLAFDSRLLVNAFPESYQR